MRRIAVVSAGLSTPSSTRMLADRLAQASLRELREHGVEASYEVFELRDHAHEIMDNMLTGFAPPALERVTSAATSADALIAVTPIFSSSYSGLFKSFVDVIDPEALAGMPVLLGANGGTARHSLALDYALRPLFAFLRAEPVTTGVFAASNDWGGHAGEAEALSSRIDRGARELAEAILRSDPRIVADPYDPETFLHGERSFDHLLGGLAGD